MNCVWTKYVNAGSCHVLHPHALVTVLLLPIDYDDDHQRPTFDSSTPIHFLVLVTIPLFQDDPHAKFVRFPVIGIHDRR